jgi:hypothetical protein
VELAELDADPGRVPLVADAGRQLRFAVQEVACPLVVAESGVEAGQIAEGEGQTPEVAQLLLHPDALLQELARGVVSALLHFEGSEGVEHPRPPPPLPHPGEEVDCRGDLPPGVGIFPPAHAQEPQVVPGVGLRQQGVRGEGQRQRAVGGLDPGGRLTAVVAGAGQLAAEEGCRRALPTAGPFEALSSQLQPPDGGGGVAHQVRGQPRGQVPRPGVPRLGPQAPFLEEAEQLPVAPVLLDSAIDGVVQLQVALLVLRNCRDVLHRKADQLNDLWVLTSHTDGKRGALRSNEARSGGTAPRSMLPRAEVTQPAPRDPRPG